FVSYLPNEVDLPFSALQVLAPPVRLVSAALWKVLKQRDVMQYGVVEEFVTSACETVPGLLTMRHQGKLALGLRARLILELCTTQPDVEVIKTHLERIRVPRKDVKIMRTVEHFHSFVHTLLSDPAKREQYFKKEFLEDYGPKFDKELEKLLWEFLIRLDQLLPVPNLAQTVSWLSNTPPVLEECARAATQPQLLKILLQHQTCLGHLESADVPVMISATKKKLQSDQPASSKDSTNQENLKFALIKEKQKAKDNGVKEGQELLEEKSFNQSSGKKRKERDNRESESEQETDEEEVLSIARSGKKRIRRDRQGTGDQRTSESEENGANAVGHECNTEVMATDVIQLGVKTLHLPDDPSLHSIFISCLTRQPRVVIEKLSVASAGTSGSGRREKSSHEEQQSQKSPVKASTHKRTSIRQTLGSKFPALDNKE
uniref:TERF1-interacting nuclear factor 2 N-terminal domain-containing protein n=1 Tax=Amphiprion ocellaris TaxID=80972 RepID=A0AAQ5Z0C6_AMPOC